MRKAKTSESKTVKYAGTHGPLWLLKIKLRKTDERKRMNEHEEGRVESTQGDEYCGRGPYVMTGVDRAPATFAMVSAAGLGPCSVRSSQRSLVL